MCVWEDESNVKRGLGGCGEFERSGMQVVENWADAVLAMIELLPASGKLAESKLKFLHRKFRPDLIKGMVRHTCVQDLPYKRLSSSPSNRLIHSSIIKILGCWNPYFVVNCKRIGAASCTQQFIARQ